MKKLSIAPGLALPLDFITETAAIIAQRRAGKTYTASVLAEEMIAAALPFVVLDPTGAWWGLRASADGKGEGLPVVIIGGAHGDVPLEPNAGKIIADLVVDHPGWYIIDLSGGMEEEEQASSLRSTLRGVCFCASKKRATRCIFLWTRRMSLPNKSQCPNSTINYCARMTACAGAGACMASA